MRIELQDLNNRLVNEKTAYETLSQIHKDISGKFMRSIKDLVEAKNSKCEMQDKMNKSQIYVDKLENEQVIDIIVRNEIGPLKCFGLLTNIITKLFVCK